MFALSYTSRCLVCRAAFIACCVVPTIGVLAYAAWLSLPSQLTHYEQQLAQQLRMSVRIGGLDRLQPGRAILRDIELAERSSHRWLARTPSLETGRNGDTIVLIASHLDLNGDGWPHLIELLKDYAAGSGGTVALSASRVNWHCGPEMVQIEQLMARLQQGDSGPVCELRFRLKDRLGTEPVRLLIARVYDGQRQMIGYEVDTGDLQLPCCLALPALPWLAQLGPRAQFSGHAIVYHGDEGWQGELRGRMPDIDLRRLLHEPLGHEVHGLAELRLERARFDQSRLTDATGTLSGGPGLTGPSLRQAAIRHLRLVASPAAAQSLDLLPYDELALEFQLDRSGLKIAGACAQAPKATLLADRHQPLLATAEPAEQVSLANLIHLLAPTSSEAVPVSRQTGWLLEILPTP
jgi:hypothetical protein